MLTQRLYHCLKAVAKYAAKRVLTAPFNSFLKVSWVRVRQASSLFTFGNREKSVWARFGERAGARSPGSTWPSPSQSLQQQCALERYPNETTSSQPPTPASSAWKPSRSCPGHPQCDWCLPWPHCHVVGVDEALGVEEGQNHLLAPAGLHLGLRSQSFPCLLCCLVWGVWKATADLSMMTIWPTIAKKAHMSSPFHCSSPQGLLQTSWIDLGPHGEWRESFWSTRHEPEQVVWDKSVTGNHSGDIGNKSQIPDHPLAVEEPLVGRQFPLLHFLLISYT